MPDSVQTDGLAAVKLANEFFEAAKTSDASLMTTFLAITGILTASLQQLAETDEDFDKLVDCVASDAKAMHRRQTRHKG